MLAAYSSKPDIDSQKYDRLVASMLTSSASTGIPAACSTLILLLLILVERFVLV